MRGFKLAKFPLLYPVLFWREIKLKSYTRSNGCCNVWWAMQKRVFRNSPFFFFAYDAHPWQSDSPPTWFKLRKISNINLGLKNFHTTCVLFSIMHNLLKACRPPESSLKLVPTLISRGEDKTLSKFCNIGTDTFFLRISSLCVHLFFTFKRRNI